MIGRDGFVLAFSVLLILALAVLAAGVVTVGAMEQALAASAGRSAQARALAESGARAVFASWSSKAVRSLPAGSVHVVPTRIDSVRATVERVDPLLFLVRSEARLGAPGLPPTVARTGLLVRVIDLERLAAAFPAAVTVDGPARVDSGRISGLDACQRAGAGGTGLQAESIAFGPDAIMEGADAVLQATPEATPWPDLFRPPVVSVLTTIEWTASRAAPGPTATVGRCLPRNGNWGAVSTGHPCHDHLPLVYVPGDLAIDRGELRGILVVDGDLVVTGSASLVGIVLVTGRLHIGPGAELVGAARAGSLHMDGGLVQWDRCEVMAALEAPSLDRGFRPGTRWWVPVF